MIREKYIYTEEMLVEAIRTGGSERDLALKHLYQKSDYKEIVRKTVTEAGGNDSDADMIFEDLLIEVDKLIRRREWLLQRSLPQFFEEESRQTWCSRLRANERLRGEVLGVVSSDKKLQKQIMGTIIKNGGKMEDAQDCYQNGIMLLDVQLREGKYKGGAIKGFFYQICFNLWRNESKRKKTSSLDWEEIDYSSTADSPEHMFESRERTEQLDKIFNALGESCQRILHLKFFMVDQFSMDEIAQQMGLKSAQNASNALSKCRKRLWELLNEQKYEHAYLWKKNV